MITNLTTKFQVQLCQNAPRFMRDIQCSQAAGTGLETWLQFSKRSFLLGIVQIFHCQLAVVHAAEQKIFSAQFC